MYVHLQIFDFYIFISVHFYYIDNWRCLCFSNSDLPFQQCLPIRKEAFPIFSLVKTNETVWFLRTHGFPTNISKNIEGKCIFRRSQTVLAAGGMGLTFGRMLAANLRSKDSYVGTRPEPAPAPSMPQLRKGYLSPCRLFQSNPSSPHVNSAEPAHRRRSF